MKYQNINKFSLIYPYSRFYQMQIHLYFYKNNFIRTEALILPENVKNKPTTKPGLLSRRT